MSKTTLVASIQFEVASIRRVSTKHAGEVWDVNFDAPDEAAAPGLFFGISKGRLALEGLPRHSGDLFELGKKYVVEIRELGE